MITVKGKENINYYTDIIEFTDINNSIFIRSYLKDININDLKDIDDIKVLTRTLNAQKPKKSKNNIIDITMELPKDVSLKAILFNDERVLLATRKAIEDTIDFIHEKIQVANKKVNKDNTRINKRENADFIAFIYEHYVNRNNEPHLHYHIVIPNAVKTKTGTGEWLSFDTNAVVKRARNIDEFLKNRLAEYLTSMGIEVELEYKNNERFNIKFKDIDNEIREIFSSRKGEILKEKEKILEELKIKKQEGRLNNNNIEETALEKIALRLAKERTKRYKRTKELKELREQWIETLRTLHNAEGILQANRKAQTIDELRTEKINELLEIQNKYNRLLEEYKRLQLEIEKAKEELKKAEQKRQETNTILLIKQQKIQKLTEEEKKLITRINMIIQQIKENKYYNVFKETEEYKNITKLINENDDEEENNNYNYRSYGPKL